MVPREGKPEGETVFTAKGRKPDTYNMKAMMTPAAKAMMTQIKIGPGIAPCEILLKVPIYYTEVLRRLLQDDDEVKRYIWPPPRRDDGDDCTCDSWRWAADVRCRLD